MGSQVNFYAAPEDEVALCRFILSDPSVVILYETRLDRPFVPVEFPLPPATEPYCLLFSLWNKSIVSQAGITPPNRVADAGNPRGCYDVNPNVYPVIEFMRCPLDDSGLQAGRIWAEMNRGSLDPVKQKLFRAWFQRLARWLNSWPYRWDMYRIGPHAKAYFDAGGKAVGFGLGEVKAVEAIGPAERLVRRGVKRHITRPEIERDEGATDLTIELDE